MDGPDVNHGLCSSGEQPTSLGHRQTQDTLPEEGKARLSRAGKGRPKAVPAEAGTTSIVRVDSKERGGKAGGQGQCPRQPWDARQWTQPWAQAQTDRGCRHPGPLCLLCLAAVPLIKRTKTHRETGTP